MPKLMYVHSSYNDRDPLIQFNKPLELRSKCSLTMYVYLILTCPHSHQFDMTVNTTHPHIHRTLDTVMLMFFQSIVSPTHTHSQTRSHVWSDTFNGHFVFEDNSIAYSNRNSNKNNKTITTSALTCCMFHVLYDVCNWSSHGNGKC